MDSACSQLSRDAFHYSSTIDKTTAIIYIDEHARPHPDGLLAGEPLPYPQSFHTSPLFSAKTDINKDITTAYLILMHFHQV